MSVGVFVVVEDVYEMLSIGRLASRMSIKWVLEKGVKGGDQESTNTGPLRVYMGKELIRAGSVRNWKECKCV